MWKPFWDVGLLLHTIYLTENSRWQSEKHSLQSIVTNSNSVILSIKQYLYFTNRIHCNIFFINKLQKNHRFMINLQNWIKQTKKGN